MKYKSKFNSQPSGIPFIADDTIGRYGVKIIGEMLGDEVIVALSVSGIWLSKGSGHCDFAKDAVIDLLCEAMWIGCGGMATEIRVHPEMLKEIESGTRTIIPEGQR